MYNIINIISIEIVVFKYRWMDIVIDIGCVNFDFLDIRRLEKGMQRRKVKKVGGNLYCIMVFFKCKF